MIQFLSEDYVKNQLHRMTNQKKIDRIDNGM